MLRYTTIHHDVREEFELSLGVYMVIDSIHQLSSTSLRDVSNVKRAKFIGVDESTIRDGIRVGIEKGLVTRGISKTTQKWADAISLASGKSREIREIPEKTSGKSRDSIIIYNNKVNAAEADFSIEDESTPKPRSVDNRVAYDNLITWLRELTGAPLRDRLKQYKWLKLAREQGREIGELKAHAELLWDNSFYKANGMDWQTVVQSIDKTSV